MHLLHELQTLILFAFVIHPNSHDMPTSIHLMAFEFFSIFQLDTVSLIKVYVEYRQIVYLIHKLSQVAYFHLEKSIFYLSFGYLCFLPDVFQYFNVFVECNNSLAIKSASSP